MRTVLFVRYIFCTAKKKAAVPENDKDRDEKAAQYGEKFEPRCGALNGLADGVGRRRAVLAPLAIEIPSSQ